MTQRTESPRADQHSSNTYALHFTPAEWRGVLADTSFLEDADNSYHSPRKLMGVAVKIVPDHRFC
jgi:hypothetical protein